MGLSSKPHQKCKHRMSHHSWELNVHLSIQKLKQRTRNPLKTNCSCGYSLHKTVGKAEGLTTTGLATKRDCVLNATKMLIEN